VAAFRSAAGSWNFEGNAPLPIDLPSERESSVSLSVAEVESLFAEYLRENEFLGHSVQAFFDGESYYIGLVYEKDAEYGYLETPMVATILLKEEADTFSLVKRNEIYSYEQGGFETPIGSGYYGKTVIDGANNVFIQTDEATFSEFNVVHQVLMGPEGLLDFSESTWELGAYTEQDGDWYVPFAGSWQRLNLDDDEIVFSSADILAFRPKTEAGDIVIEVADVDPETFSPTFTLNGESLMAEDFSDSGTGMGQNYHAVISVSPGTKVYFLDHPDAAFYHSFYDWASEAELPVEQGIGYAMLDTGGLDGSISLTFYHFADAYYTFDLEVE